MPNRNSELNLYLAKNESTEGTDPTPTPTANAIELSENFEPDDDYAFKPEAENRVRGPILAPGDPMSVAGRMMNQKRAAFLRGTTGAPTAGNRIELDPWFLAAGMSATYDATPGSEKVSYIPADSGHTTITEWYYRDGIVYKYNAVRGEWMMSFDAGGAVKIGFDPHGRVGSVADASVPTNGAFSSVEWPLATDATTFTIDGFTAGIIRHWEHALGNNVQMRPGVKATGGIQGWRITRRNPVFKVVLEEELFSTKDFHALRANKTPIAISWLIGGTTFNRFDFSAARAFIRKVTPSQDNGLALVTLEGTLRGSTQFTLAIR